MNIAILSRKSNLYFNEKIKTSAKKQTINVEIIDPLQCELYLSKSESIIKQNGKILPKIDIVIPRMSNTILAYGLNVLRHFEILGSQSLNSSKALSGMISRFDYLQFLSTNLNLLTTKSVLVRKSNQIKNALSFVGGPPAILKIISGHDKLGAMLIENPSSIETLFDVTSIFGGFEQIGQTIMIEEYIKEANCRSIHSLIIDNSVIASYYKIKTFNNKQLSSIISKPNSGMIDTPEEIKLISQDISRYLGLDIFEIGFLESSQGYKIFEINVIPDIEIINKIHQISVEDSIINFLKNNCNKNSDRIFIRE